MRNMIWGAAVFAACMLRIIGANAEDLAAGCKATPENAKYQLEKAAGDAAQALTDWLHYCPNQDLMVKYAEQIQKAKAGPNQKPSTPAAAATPAPAPKSKSEPYGTFAQSGRANYEDHSGYEDWDDTLIIREDGTAESRTRYKVTFNQGWHLSGCDEGVRQGIEVISRKYKVTISGSTVTLEVDGARQRSGVEPACWKVKEDPQASIGPWVLTWTDGRLKDREGEYFRQN